MFTIGLSLFYAPFFALLILNIGLYALIQLLAAFVFKAQNLKRKYNAQWALVTGGSSGIGKSLAWKLASQGIHVVIVAIPEPTLDVTVDELRSAYPAVEIRKVGVNLSGDDYLNEIKEATKDIQIQLIFCNAGYLVTGFFHQTTLKQQMDNLNCNVSSAVAVSHHFITLMVRAKLKGCVVFTSSPAGAMPGPFSSLYASTKSFLSMFGASIAAEVKSHGIDVLVFHPSPIASRFYDNQKKIDMLDFFKQFALKPDTVPDQVFAAIGRMVWADLGLTAMVFRLLIKIVDFNFLATLLANIAHLMPDYKRHNK